MKSLLLSLTVGGGLVALSIAAASAEKDAKDIYLDKCAVCHGQDGAGKTAKGRKLKVMDVHETVKKSTVDQMIKVVQEGKGNDMDGYGKELSKDEIKAVVEHYRGLAKQ
jgi:mono/diheme cytochrome c family protein